MTAQTSDKSSRLAARYIKLDPDTLLALTATEGIRKSTAAEIRSMAASLLRQDENKGLRGLIRKVLG